MKWLWTLGICKILQEFFSSRKEVTCKKALLLKKVKVVEFFRKLLRAPRWNKPENALLLQTKPLFFFPKSLSKDEVTSSSIKTGLLNSHGLAGWSPLDWNACPACGASDSDDGAVWDIWSPHPLLFNQIEWCICVRPGRPLWLSATVALGPTDWLIKHICYILTSLWKFRTCCVIGFSRSVYSLLKKKNLD